MKWTYSIKNKAVASAALLVLCLLVLFSNYVDRSHTRNVKQSISTLYEDRLIAEDYILQMTIFLYEIKEELKSDTNNISKNKNIDNLLLSFKETSSLYQKTKFTEAERAKDDELAAIVAKFESPQTAGADKKLEYAGAGLAALKELSAIQLSESKQIMTNAEQLYHFGKISSQFVFVLIIIILIVLQALVFASKSLIIKEDTHSSRFN